MNEVGFEQGYITCINLKICTQQIQFQELKIMKQKLQLQGVMKMEN